MNTFDINVNIKECDNPPLKVRTCNCVLLFYNVSYQDDSDDDGDAISCSISVSLLTKTRQDVVGKVLSGLDDRLLCTEHITNPENKCLPLRMKGRIHETASKRGQRHIRLEIGENSVY